MEAVHELMIGAIGLIALGFATRLRRRANRLGVEAVRLGLNSREYKSVSVEPIGILGVEGHEFIEHNVSDRSHPHGGSGMPGISFEGSIDLEQHCIVRIVAFDTVLDGSQ